ncbi:MAG TPA: hypothetical protein VMV60_01285 [Thermoanaerobaculia bacterium]|nr:hypothetical protein [Thermoanaerobaculia bacterium]
MAEARSPLAGAAACLLGVLAALTARPGAGSDTFPGPPFDLGAKTPHEIVFTIDTQPARDVLGLLSGAPGPTAALRRLKASGHATQAIRAQSLSPDDYYGKLVAAVAGTPDPLFSSFIARGPFFAKLLDEMEGAGPALAAVEAKRVGSILPGATPVKARVVIVPFFAISGFAEIVAVNGGGEIVLAADLPRLVGDVSAAPEPREVLLKLLRGTSAEAWRALFESNVRKTPAWPGSEKALDFDALLARTVAEGPGTLFLVPDEFFPLSPLLGEPIARDFARWNRAAEILLDGKAKDAQRQEMFQNAGKGDFWQRYPAIVGAQMTDGLLRLAGRETFLAALAAGPRAVAALYVSATKGKGYPEFSKLVKKALEVKPSAAAGKP